MLKAASLGIIAASVFSAGSQAEIYQCRDANGRASFSQTPCPLATVTGDSEAHKIWRDLRSMASRGRNISKQLGADLESIKQCTRSSQAYLDDVTAFEPRMSTIDANKHQHLFSAQQLLLECGRCRVSAQQYCSEAEQHLDKEINTLLPPVASAKRHSQL